MSKYKYRNRKNKLHLPNQNSHHKKQRQMINKISKKIFNKIHLKILMRNNFGLRKLNKIRTKESEVNKKLFSHQ